MEKKKSNIKPFLHQFQHEHKKPPKKRRKKDRKDRLRERLRPKSSEAPISKEIYSLCKQNGIKIVGFNK